MGLRDTLELLLRHPLNRDRRLAAIARYLRWQVGSLLVPGQVAVPFVGRSLLLASFGMASATGNVYAGLYEFEDMALALHLLRPGDLFVDVGANIGAYTVLAGAAVGADCVALEPVPSTFAQLRRNVDLNGIGARVELRNVAAGAGREKIRFTDGLGPMNRVATDGERAALEVEVLPLDEIVGAREPLLIKIDVEGFETRVVDGASAVLARPSLLAVLMERNGNGRRYGFDEAALHARVRAAGFRPHRYHPLTRLLVAGEPARHDGNVLYLREGALARAQARVTGAPRYPVAGREL
jgi:FkbM family methyltransferase